MRRSEFDTKRWTRPAKLPVETIEFRKFLRRELSLRLASPGLAYAFQFVPRSGAFGADFVQRVARSFDHAQFVANGRGEFWKVSFYEIHDEIVRFLLRRGTSLEGMR